ncbi:hypothetical protein SGCZBJ_13120 [Caulobacter zeae]|uniref:Uncharacterized protein n=2 Tax=Caulobacter zeae TaxID=2055137 RepID=A0A2N5DGJ5_9CAUL|nr:hypothetical protein SGCZBJ_13120 [Caulobacter zeae]
MGLDQTRSLAPYTSVMAEKSEQIDALLTEIRDLVVETYHGAAKELLTQAQGEAPKARMEASKLAALVGRPVEMLHAARLRSQKISASRQPAADDGEEDEADMHGEIPTDPEELRAAVESKVAKLAELLERKRRDGDGGGDRRDDIGAAAEVSQRRSG